jgi:hypothetical protein
MRQTAKAAHEKSLPAGQRPEPEGLTCTPILPGPDMARPPSVWTVNTAELIAATTATPASPKLTPSNLHRQEQPSDTAETRQGTNVVCADDLRLSWALARSVEMPYEILSQLTRPLPRGTRLAGHPGS